MKTRLFLFLVCILFALNGNSQIKPWQRSIPNFNAPTAMLLAKDSSIVIAKTIDGTTNAFSSTIQLISKNGNILNTQIADSGYTNFITRLISDSNDDIYAYGYFDQDCDFPIPNYFCLFKYNSHLNLIWKRRIITTSNGFLSPPPGGIALDSKNNLLATLGKEFYTLDSKTGKIKSMITLSSIIPSDIFLSSSEQRIFINSGMAVKMDSNMTLIWKKSFASRRIKKIGTNLFVAILDSEIKIIDSGLNVLHSLKLPKQYIKFHDVTLEDSIFYLSAKINMGHSVDALIKLDYSLNVLSAKPIEKIVEANCISIRNGFIAIAGEDRTNDFVTRTLVKVCDTSGIFDSSKYDMGVINLISTSIKLDKSSGVAKIYFDAVIKNFGNKIVDSVTVYTGGAMEYDCGDFNASQTFHGLALAPGDTARVTLGYIYCEYFSNTKYYYLCAYTCSPNEEADQNYNNDSKCDTVLITSLDDVIGNYPAIIIYPNPAHDILKIGCSQTLQCSYSIINAIGQFFQNGRMILSEESEISIEKLPRGMYFLKINMGYKSETVKFIKE